MVTFPVYLYLLFFIIAYIYSLVGHGGASGYLAVLALTGMLNPGMVPVVLVLNILVSSIAFFNYQKKGYFKWKLFWPFGVASVPAAFVGGWLKMEGEFFYILAGLVLLAMAGGIVFRVIHRISYEQVKPVRISGAFLAGSGIGFLSGLIGVGGGIFLTPFMLFMNWGTIRQIAAVSALFILVNSSSGLSGHAFTTHIWWTATAQLTLPVVAGGVAGSLTGVKAAKPELIKGMLAVVLIIAGVKMLIL